METPTTTNQYPSTSERVRTATRVTTQAGRPAAADHRDMIVSPDSPIGQLLAVAPSITEITVTFADGSTEIYEVHA